MNQAQNQSTRGQTLPDFALAFGIFIIGIGIAYGATASLFSQYSSNQESIVEGDRIANQLVVDTFVSEENNTGRYMLDTECTVTAVQALNGDSISPVTDCSYNPSIVDASPNEYFGYGEEGGGFNITIVDSDSNIITLDGVEMDTGNDVPDVADTVTTVRIVYLNDTVYQIRVVTW